MCFFIIGYKNLFKASFDEYSSIKNLCILQYDIFYNILKFYIIELFIKLLHRLYFEYIIIQHSKYPDSIKQSYISLSFFSSFIVCSIQIYFNIFTISSSPTFDFKPVPLRYYVPIFSQDFDLNICENNEPTFTEFTNKVLIKRRAF